MPILFFQESVRIQQLVYLNKSIVEGPKRRSSLVCVRFAMTYSLLSRFRGGLGDGLGEIRPKHANKLSTSFVLV